MEGDTHELAGGGVQSQCARAEEQVSEPDGLGVRPTAAGASAARSTAPVSTIFATRKVSITLLAVETGVKDGWVVTDMARADKEAESSDGGASRGRGDAGSSDTRDGSWTHLARLRLVRLVELLVPHALSAAPTDDMGGRPKP